MPRKQKLNTKKRMHKYRKSQEIQRKEYRKKQEELNAILNNNRVDEILRGCRG